MDKLVCSVALFLSFIVETNYVLIFVINFLIDFFYFNLFTIACSYLCVKQHLWKVVLSKIHNLTL